MLQKLFHVPAGFITEEVQEISVFRSAQDLLQGTFLIEENLKIRRTFLQNDRLEFQDRQHLLASLLLGRHDRRYQFIYRYAYAVADLYLVAEEVGSLAFDYARDLDAFTAYVQLYVVIGRIVIVQFGYVPQYERRHEQCYEHRRYVTPQPCEKSFHRTILFTNMRTAATPEKQYRQRLSQHKDNN